MEHKGWGFEVYLKLVSGNLAKASFAAKALYKLDSCAPQALQRTSRSPSYPQQSAGGESDLVDKVAFQSAYERVLPEGNFS
jgi:hypothetical protein